MAGPAETMKPAVVLALLFVVVLWLGWLLDRARALWGAYDRGFSQ